MRKTVLFAVAALLIALAAPRMIGSDGQTQCQLDIVNNYYSDNSYSTAVGWDERDCSCSFNAGGSDTSWRYHEIYSCEGDQLSAGCQEYVPGSGWVGVACPDEGVTAQVRIRIPVG